MSISDELEKLDALRRRGVISSEEFEIGKRKILEGSGGFDQYKESNDTTAEIAELDRAWELEQKNYEIVGKYGRRYQPGKVRSVVGGVVMAGFGLFWTVMAFSITRGGFGAPGFVRFFPLFGILFIIFAMVSCVRGVTKAHQFEEAQERYRQRRRMLKEQRR